MRFTFLRRLFGLDPARRADLRIVMYSRTGCHLCDEAWLTLSQARATYGFQLETRDVDASPEWAELYGERVPVVTVNGEVRFWGRINPVLLQRLLKAALHSD